MASTIDAQQQSVIVDQPESEGVSPQTVTAPAAPTEPDPSKQGRPIWYIINRTILHTI